MPSCWSEMTSGQLQVYCAIQRKLPYHAVSYELIARLLNLDEPTKALLLPADWHALAANNEWLLSPKDISTLIISDIKVGDKTMLGYLPDFSNTTWEEFIFADTFAAGGNAAALAATLYRPRRPDADKEHDERIPFTMYGLDARLEDFSKLPAETLEAVMLNYTALQRRMVAKYKDIFPKISPDKAKNKPSPPLWLETHRALIGDAIQDERQFLALPVNTVLSRLDSVARENKKNRLKIRK